MRSEGAIACLQGHVMDAVRLIGFGQEALEVLGVRGRRSGGNFIQAEEQREKLTIRAESIIQHD